MRYDCSPKYVKRQNLTGILWTAAYQDYPGSLLDNGIFLVKHFNIQGDLPTAKPACWFEIGDRYFKVDGITDEHRAAVFPFHTAEGNGGAVHEAHLVRQSCSDAEAQGAVRDTCAEVCLFGEFLIGM